jgi:hypothetical protein
MFEKELCLPNFAPEHNYLVHDFELPLPSYITDIHFDAIILTQTFLSKRQDPRFRKRLNEVYAFIGSMQSFKIALPQDDYTCSGILDRLLNDWKVDLVYPVCINDWDILYPTFSKVGRMKQGFTGYITDEMIKRTNSPIPLVERSIDVAYRAAKLPPVFGRLGQIKTDYGDLFLKASKGLPLKVDVSTRLQDAILGLQWYDFIESSRCMLGVNSGSSILDPEGIINQKVFSYLELHPKASFEEVEAACFPGQEGKYEFTAISPRNLECALFGTVQILAPGSYGGFMQEEGEYIPLEPDMSNFSDIVPLLTNHSYLKTIADRCREAILSFPELRYNYHNKDLIREIKRHTKLNDVIRLKSVPLIRRHQKEMIKIASAYWHKQRIVTKVRKVLGDLGLRRFKYLIKHLKENN